MPMINLLVKIPFFGSWFEKEIYDYAFKKRYVDKESRAKLREWFILPSGTRYYKFLKDEWMPVTRYDEMQARLLEMESRIGREDLTKWISLAETCVNEGKISDLGHLVGLLKERVDLLFDPVLMVQFISGIAIREDQIDTAQIWNVEIENEKFNEIFEQVKGGGLSDFFQSLRLTDIVAFSDLSINGSEITNPQILDNQLKQVQAFNRVLQSLALKLKSSNGRKIKNRSVTS